MVLGAGNAAGAPVLPEYRVRVPPLAEPLLDDRARPPRLSCMPWLKRLGLRILRPKAGGCWAAVSAPPPAGEWRRLLRSTDWSRVRAMCADWIKNPMNTALLLWLLCVGASGAMYVLLLLGWLDRAFPAPALRSRWVEINNQVLNALFTLMSIYQHPSLCHHLFLLCRWRPEDAAELRAAYCKASAPRPRERAHLAAVLLLLHLTVGCQYVLCGLYWGYPRSRRPELVEGSFFALGVAAPVAAVAYTVLSPLGREEEDLTGSSGSGVSSPDVVASAVTEREWAGGMFDCGGDAAALCLAGSCTFCVFGWNMERLGFGNKYVHASTFLLLCIAPLWVFGVSALRISSRAIGDTLGGAGVLLCVLGLLYGGYWRIQARKSLGLPGSRLWCMSESMTDYARWLFCWPCALAQEVRTASACAVGGGAAGEAEEEKPLVAPVQVVIQIGGGGGDEAMKRETVVGGGEANAASGLSLRNWRVEGAKKLINVITLASFLALMYTRGFAL